MVRHFESRAAISKAGWPVVAYGKNVAGCLLHHNPVGAVTLGSLL